MLRFVTWLAPGLPLELFERVAAHCGTRLASPTTVLSVISSSGPVRGAPDPFSRGEADVGFVCAPSLLWMRQLPVPPVELVPAAPIFAHPRSRGLPIYWADVVVSRASPAKSFLDLAGQRFVYNDGSSLSGWYSLLDRLRALGREADFFSQLAPSGSHHASLRAVAEGRSDGAAIDSNVLAACARRDPDLVAAVRVVESWGPFPIQPVIVRSTLPPSQKRGLAEALLAMPAVPEVDLAGFAPIDLSAYEGERAALAACELVRA